MDFSKTALGQSILAEKKDPCDQTIYRARKRSMLGEESRFQRANANILQRFFKSISSSD
jgi:hypothetical protein